MDGKTSIEVVSIGTALLTYPDISTGGAKWS
jgi:hypothetical protein